MTAKAIIFVESSFIKNPHSRKDSSIERLIKDSKLNNFLLLLLLKPYDSECLI